MQGLLHSLKSKCRSAAPQLTVGIQTCVAVESQLRACKSLQLIASELGNTSSDDRVFRKLSKKACRRDCHCRRLFGSISGRQLRFFEPGT